MTVTGFDGRVAIVTGAAQGIGYGIAERLAADGARLALVDLDEEALAKAAVALAPRHELITLTVDLADDTQARTVADQVLASFGRIDVLVNNAGVRTVASLVDHPLDTWRRTLDVNLTAPFVLIQSVAPHMIERGGGRIVNVTSIAAELGFKNRVAYNVSKAGLAMLTKTVALELGGHGIRCNAVAPGIIETPLNSDYFRDDAFAGLIRDATPAGTWGAPRDIAAAVAFLAGDDAGFVNGATILVDGGWSTGKGY
jgi:NAD(P)-dependent dehydrogenase (short-subunit alcohol dehydrogenase family)